MTKKTATKKTEAVKPTDGKEPDNFELTQPDLDDLSRKARHEEAKTVSLQLEGDERLREALGIVRNEYSEMMPGVRLSNSDIVRALILKAAKG